jgi:hypothetical protein
MFLARRDTGLHGGLEGSLRRMVERSPDSQVWRCILAVFLASCRFTFSGSTKYIRAAAEYIKAGEREIAIPAE